MPRRLQLWRDPGLRATLLSGAALLSLAASAPAAHASSGANDAAPVRTAVPTVTGIPRRGQLLSASTGTSRPAARSYRYQWLRSRNGGRTWTRIKGARRSRYLLVKSDEGARISVRVTAISAQGRAAVQSRATAAVRRSPPGNSSPPVISGTGQRGFTLSTVTVGSWSGAGNAVSLRWQRSTRTGWQSISGARRATYTPAKSDEGARVRLLVAESNSDGSLAVPSNPTAPVTPAPPLNVSPPAITGTPRPGAALSASAGGWTPPRSKFAYRGQRCTADVTSITTTCTQVATGPTYTLAVADAGYRIAVRVTASAAGGTTSADSPMSEPVGSAVVSLGAVVRAVPHSFLGISTETDEFDDFVQKVPSFPALLKQLAVVGDKSPVSLRIGGESADGTYLNADGFSTPSGVKSFGIDLPYLQRLGALARSVPLTVTLDLNLAAHDPQMAAALATEAQKAL